MSITINGTTGVSGVDGSVGTPAFQGTDTDTGLFYSANTVSISTGGSTAITVDSSQRAAFVAGTAALPAITTTGDTNTGIFFPAADTIAFTEGGAEAMRIDSSGNVGIGTTSPTNFGSNFKMLAIQGSDFGVIQAISNSGSTTIEMMGASGTGFLGTRTNHPLALRTNDTERMRIDTSGNLWFGTSTFSSSMQSGLSLQPASNSQLWVSHANGTGSGQYYAVFFYNGSNIGGVTQNGTTAVAYNTSSDYRLKENIVPMTGALDKVAQLKPVTYRWKIDGSDGQGFIAHELAEIVPDCVTGEKDAVNEDGSIKPQGIDTSFLVATLTAAIQEQQTIIQDLKARIETLEASNV